MSLAPDASQIPGVRLSVVMPAYNEGHTINEAVSRVLEAEHPCDMELLVVDDGSSDHTQAELAKINDPRLRVLRHPRNLGKGAAVLTAISEATGTHLLPFDADLEYSPHDIGRMVEPVIEGKAEVVYGTRLFGLNTRYHSFRYKLGNRATTLAANLLFDSAVTDIHTCLKLVPLNFLRSLPLSELGFGLDSEITANVLRAGKRPFEVPIAYYARSHEQGKKIRWQDGVRCLTVLTRVRMQAKPEVAAPVQPALPAAGATVETTDAVLCERCGDAVSELDGNDVDVIDLTVRRHPVRIAGAGRGEAAL